MAAVTELSYSLHIVHNSFNSHKAAELAASKLTKADIVNGVPSASKSELDGGIILANLVGGVAIVRYCGKFLIRKV